MTVKYVAVGFRVDTSRSIFYFKETDLVEFLVQLKDQIRRKKPDFISLRMVKSDT